MRLLLVSKNKSQEKKIEIKSIKRELKYDEKFDGTRKFTVVVVATVKCSLQKLHDENLKFSIQTPPSVYV